MKFTLDEGAFAPEYAHSTDAGMDIRTPIDVTLKGTRKKLGGSSVIIDTGVHVEIPDGCVGFFKSKSGLNVKHNIVSEGVIDEGYTGSLVVKLYNHGENDYEFKRGDKITQLVIIPVNHVELTQVDSLEVTERGDGGFGSTGR